MNARSLFLLPVALVALSVGGCDSVTPPEAPGLQASPTAPTANVYGSISGPSRVQYYCTAIYTFDSEELLDLYAYWVISGGGATIVSQSPSSVTVMTGGSVSSYTLTYKSGGGVTIDTFAAVVRSTGDCGPE